MATQETFMTPRFATDLLDPASATVSAPKTQPSKGTRSTFPETPATGSAHARSSTLFVVAVMENRAREIGIAAMNLKSPELVLIQMADSPTYVHTLRLLELYEPVEILISATLIDNSTLHTIVENEFTDAKIVSVARKYFDETRGLSLLKELAATDATTIDLEAQSKYLSLAAAHALLRYVELIQSVVFVPRTLKVKFQGLEGQMMIDAASLKSLEVVRGVVSGSPKDSLFGIVDQTKTAMGKRLLRASLMQPLCDIPTINMRLDCVDELINSEQMFFAIKAALEVLIDTDHLLSNWVRIPKKASIRTAETCITSVIQLKHMLYQVGELRDAMKDCQNPLLQAMHRTFQLEAVDQLVMEIDKYVSEDTAYTKSSLRMRTQKTFAVKPGINGLLDTARQSFSETMEEIYAMAKRYREEYDLPTVKVEFNNRRGWFLSMSETRAALPEVFVQVLHQGKRCQFTTENMIRMSERNQEAQQEITLMTERVVQDLMAEVRCHLNSLYAISETLAMLDLLMSFAGFITLNDQYVRPLFNPDGPIAIQNGRHVTMEKMRQEQYVPNDTFITESSNLQVITGPNMAGKSTYMKQIALMTILAHIGCYVPASYANFRVVDRLFTRLGTGDSIETNSSTFMLEMRETAFILQNVTDNSLVIIDELGRGTSTLEGLGIAWAVAEFLLHTKAYTFFVTHFLQLAQLADLYPSVKVYQLAVNNIQNQLAYTYAFTEGCCDTPQYGLQAASLAGFPNDLMEDAYEISAKLKVANIPQHLALKTRKARTQAELVRRFRSI